LIFLYGVLSGCASTFSEKHHFKSVDAENNTVNYYRLSVEGHTFMSSARYLSGYFDERAVDAYFSQIAQPKNATFIDNVQSDGGNVQPLGGELNNRKLVLLLSSNSDAIAQQIGQFVNNNAVMEDLTKIIYRDRIIDSQNAQAAAELQQARGTALADIGERVIGQMPDNADFTTVEANVLFYVNRLAAEFGNTTPLTSLDDARKWLEYNRARIQEGE
jgi:hypothetical protein